jgi:RNA polymerase sigma factor (sigma-70 family)
MTTAHADHRHDELLAVRCQLGERAAFDDLIARWHGPLWTYARRVVGDDDGARDAVQDIWLRAIRGIARLRDATRLRAWLFGIARRTLMDRLREQYARAAESGGEPADQPDDRHPPDLEGDLQVLEIALAQLPILEREVLTLFYLQELSLADVADALDVPPGTVKSRLFRARQALRARMEARGVHR